MNRIEKKKYYHFLMDDFRRKTRAHFRMFHRFVFVYRNCEKKDGESLK